MDFHSLVHQPSPRRSGVRFINPVFKIAKQYPIIAELNHKL